MDSDGVLGYACCLVAAIFFGSNYVPVKKLTNLGDGVFFSVCLTLGVFTVGVVVCLVRSFPKFEYQAMFGGSLWAIGNLCVVPIVKSIGLAARDDDLERRVHAFWVGEREIGIFGLDKEEVSRPGLNGFESRWRVWRCTWRRRLMGRRIVIVIVIAAATATAIARVV